MVLGNNHLPKVPIYSFIIRSRTGKLLHFNFVTSLLNDLFGIQVRGGCSCAAIYGQKILGIDLHKSREYKQALFLGQELMRMGFNRFGIPYWFTDEEIDFVLKAIEFVAQYGWMFLPNYTFDVHKGEWLSRYFKEHKHRIWLGSIDYGNGNFDSEHLLALREEKSFH